jgi:hypothetical protein
LRTDSLTAYRPERAAFIVRHTLEAANAVDFPMQTFRGGEAFPPASLSRVGRARPGGRCQAGGGHTCRRQRRREEEERERRWRLADRRAALSEGRQRLVRQRGEEALAADGVARTHLGYDVLVKLKVDDLLEQEGIPMPESADGAHPPAAVTARR